VELGRGNTCFLGLEKQRQVRKSINKLYDDNSKKQNDQTELLNKIKHYVMYIAKPRHIDSKR
jgi:hypothetical protein